MGDEEERKHGGKADEIEMVGRLKDRCCLWDLLQITEHTAYPISTKNPRLDQAPNAPCFAIVFERRFFPEDSVLLAKVFRQLFIEV